MAGPVEPPSMVNRVRRLEYLAVRALATQMGIHSADIAYLASGKPYLKDSNLTISISHTKGYVAVLMSAHGQAGVDVEHTTDRVRKIRQKFMHPMEETVLTEVCKSINETLGLLLHWCAKEAMFKAVPEDGVDFAQELRIIDFGLQGESGSFQGCFLRTGRNFKIDYLMQPDFVLTCSFSAESK